MVLIDDANAPRRNSTSAAGSIAAALEDPVTDPLSKDTDLDGLGDNFELTPYKNGLTYGGITATLQPTSPEHPDTDADGLSDGVERRLGGNPRSDDSDRFTDSDGDGLTDAQEVGDDNHELRDRRRREGVGRPQRGRRHRRRREEEGRRLGGQVHDDPPTLRHRRPVGRVHERRLPTGGQHAPATGSSRRSSTPDTDDDGLTDFEERQLLTDPGCRLWRTGPGLRTQLGRGTSTPTESATAWTPTSTGSATSTRCAGSSSVTAAPSRPSRPTSRHRQRQAKRR